jgi:7-carboxy-7-deazaguanine synthase
VRLPPVTDRATVLTVNEIFGPTFQGEGPLAGQCAMFIRLFGCSLRCQWCDTAWTWDPARFELTGEQHPMTVPTILDRLRPYQPGLIVITGGEPLLQQQALVTLCEGIREARIAAAIQIETSGTVPPLPALTAAVSMYCVSPKLANSGMRLHQRIRPVVLRQFALSGKAVFKFVACGCEDLDEIAQITASYGLVPVWVMPEGTSSTTVLTRMRELAGPVAERGWNLTARLQALLWEDDRGH